MKVTFISILLIIAGAHAKAASHKTLAVGTKPKLSTDIKFDGQNVGGQIQAPFESLTEVENEKQIDQLIGVRKNFKDRVQKANELR